MTFKRRGLGVQQDKAYFQVVLSQVARGSRQFEYVTEDAAATVEGTSYISTATADGQLTIDEVAVGDLIWYWQVTTADDDQTIEDDKASGVSDNKIYRVSDNDGTALTLEETNFGATGSLSTSGTPESGDLAEFTNSATVRGRTLAELDLLTATDAAAAYQSLDADLTAVAALTTTAAGLSTLEIADPGADRILAWDDTAGAVAAIAIAAITAEASPASGDFFLAYTAEGALVKVDYDDMPAGGGSGDVTKVGTPVDNQLGVWTGDGTIEGDTGLTYDGSALTVSVPIFQAEASADAASASGFGQWWVKDDAPNVPMFTDDAGNDGELLTNLTIGTDVQAQGDVLDDLNSLGAASSNGEFIVATGAGAFAYESGSTARASLGVDAAETASEDNGDYSSTRFEPASGVGVDTAFTGAQNHILEFQTDMTVSSSGQFFAPTANTLDVRAVVGVSINGVAGDTNALPGNAGIVPAGGYLAYRVIATNTVLIWGTTNADQSLAGALTVSGLLTAGGNLQVTGTADFDDDVTGAASASGFGLIPVTRGAGSSNPTAVDSSKHITTDGAITIPNGAIGDGWFVCTLEIGADTHDITHNSITLDISAAGAAAGEIYSVITKSASVIRIQGPAGTFTESDMS